MQMAAKHFALVEDDPAADETLKKMNAAILASAMGEWTEASELLKAILEKDANNFVVSFVAWNFLKLLDKQVD